MLPEATKAALPPGSRLGTSIALMASMDIRIDSRTEGRTTIVDVSGHLGIGGAEALRKTCGEVHEALFLELSGLISADAEGLRALHELQEHGATLRAMAPFVRLLMAELDAPVERAGGGMRV